MENRDYSINEVGNLGGNDKVKTNLFVLFVLKINNSIGVFSLLNFT